MKRLLQTAVFLCATALAAVAAAPRPNIVFILCDDLGYGDLGVFFQNQRKTANDRSEPWHFTPKLDTMAGEGVQLRGHYCPAPVCAPSRASLLTGVTQGHANVRDNDFDKALENNHTLATVLKGAGYSTAVIGKWGLQGGGSNPTAWPAYPTKRGFDYFFGYVRHADGHEHYPKEGLYSGAKEVWDMNSQIASQLDKCYTTDLFTARAKKWIVDQRAADPSKPFFLYLAYDAPHATIELPTGPFPAGSGLTGGMQWTGTPGAMINTASGTPDTWYHPDYAAATWDHDKNGATAEQAWPDVDKRYATSVRRIDDCVGDLIQTLKDLGIDNDTLVVFSTDNGISDESYLSQALNPYFFNSFGPFDGIKRDCWEGGIRVGALARWPGGIPAGRVDERPSQFHDWMPTFSELAGVPAPSRTDGVSLVPTLEGTGVQRDSTIYVEYNYNGSTPSYAEFAPAHRGRQRKQMQVIRFGDLLGVRYNIANHADDFEIYNIVADPQQTANLAASNTALQQKMKDAVLQRRRTGSAARPYDSEPVPTLSPTPTVVNGLRYQAYTGAFPWVPDFTLESTATEGETTLPDPAVRTRDADVGLRFTGYLKVPADGSYTFSLATDTGAFVRLHDAQLLDADFGYTGGTEVSTTIPLKAGYHPIRIDYRHRDAAAHSLALQWAGPGIVKQPVPATAYFRDGVPVPVAPTAADDAATTLQGAAVDIDVLANDSDDGSPQPLSIVSVSPGARGDTAIVGGKVRYTPVGGFLGTDTFEYRITDGESDATAKVSVQVVFADGSWWFPFNQTSGLTTLEAGGAGSATLRNFSGSTAPWVAGRQDRGISFDGTDDHLTIDGFTGILGTNPRTIAAWVKTTASGSDRAIAGWGPNSSGNKWSFLMNSAGRLRLEATGGFVVGTQAVNDGQWHHVACTFANDGSPSSTDVKLYVDGTLETVSASGVVTVNTTASGEAKIGSDIQNRHWNGVIDEFRIYNRALSASELTTLIAQGDAPALAWHRRFFGNGAVDWAQDDDGDGRNRLFEFAFGSQPGIPDSGNVVGEPSIAGGKLTIAFPRRRAGSHSMTYAVQVSPDLADWTTLSATEVSVVPLNADFDKVTCETPAPAAERRFVRIRVAGP